MHIKNYVVKTILVTALFTTLIQQASFRDMTESERIRQEKMMQGRQSLFEIGKQGVPASTNREWNFELQNKYEGGFIGVELYYYDQNTKKRSYIFETRLMPFGKVRADINPNRQIMVDIYFEGKLFKKITPKLCRNIDKRDCYKTIYLTLGIDGSVYPQTGILKGLTNTTDSGLDNSQNIPPSALISITY